MAGSRCHPPARPAPNPGPRRPARRRSATLKDAAAPTARTSITRPVPPGGLDRHDDHAAPAFAACPGAHPRSHRDRRRRPHGHGAGRRVERRRNRCSRPVPARRDARRRRAARPALRARRPDRGSPPPRCPCAPAGSSATARPPPRSPRSAHHEALLAAPAHDRHARGRGVRRRDGGDRGRHAARAAPSPQQLATTLGMRPVDVADADRAAYHAAASIASNFLVTLEGLAERLAATAGVDREPLVALVAGERRQLGRAGRRARPDRADRPRRRGHRRAPARRRRRAPARASSRCSTRSPTPPAAWPPRPRR